jgi:hypothetical protein
VIKEDAAEAAINKKRATGFPVSTGVFTQPDVSASISPSFPRHPAALP